MEAQHCEIQSTAIRDNLPEYVRFLPVVSGPLLVLFGAQFLLSTFGVNGHLEDQRVPLFQGAKRNDNSQ